MTFTQCNIFIAFLALLLWLHAIKQTIANKKYTYFNSMLNALAITIWLKYSVYSITCPFSSLKVPR